MHSNIGRIRLTFVIISILLCVGEMGVVRRVGVARYINPLCLKILDPALVVSENVTYLSVTSAYVIAFAASPVWKRKGVDNYIIRPLFKRKLSRVDLRH